MLFLNIAKAYNIFLKAFFLDYFYYLLRLCSFTQLLDLAIVVNLRKHNYKYITVNGIKVE